jgi:glutathione S-transferase
MAASQTKLYVIPGSAPCAAVEAALALKSIDYDRVELVPLSQLFLGRLYYGGHTVPGMRLRGERLVGSGAIMRRLDALVPEPALFGDREGATGGAVLDAERWGEEVLQSLTRRLFNLALVAKPTAAESYLANASLNLSALRPAAAPIARLLAWRNNARDKHANAAELPGHLDRVDGWIADGVLGGEQPNAADLQIGSSIRFLMTIADVRPAIEGRPAGALVRYFPPMDGEIKAGALTAVPAPAARA